MLIRNFFLNVSFHSLTPSLLTIFINPIQNNACYTETQIYSPSHSINRTCSEMEKKCSCLKYKWRVNEEKTSLPQQELRSSVPHRHLLQDSLCWMGFCWQSQVKYGYMPNVVRQTAKVETCVVNKYIWCFRFHFTWSGFFLAILSSSSILWFQKNNLYILLKRY